MDKLNILFGTAGIPFSSQKKDTPYGIKRINELNLSCMELEFVHGVKMGDKSAKMVKEAKENYKILLSVHAPYYINLNANEPEKITSSIERIVHSALVGIKCSADKLTFHPGFYLDKTPAQCFKNIVLGIEKILRNISDNISLAPETTGKDSAFGSIGELIALCKEFDKLTICVDFSHVYARSLGEINNYKGFAETIEKIIKVKSDYINDAYFHVSGIIYGKYGEKKHTPLSESEFNWKELMKVLKDFNIKGRVICESPILEEDAIIMQEYYRSL